MSERYVVADYYTPDDYITAGIFIDWGEKRIFIPRNYPTLVQSTPTEIREMDLNAFRLALKAAEASQIGVPYVDTHRHNTEVNVGGVTLARVVEIINDYVIEFENGQYAVNLIGANSNVGDRVLVNQVSVRSANSAGLITVGAQAGGECPTVDQIVAALIANPAMLTVAKYLGLKS